MVNGISGLSWAYTSMVVVCLLKHLFRRDWWRMTLWCVHFFKQWGVLLWTSLELSSSYVVKAAWPSAQMEWMVIQTFFDRSDNSAPSHSMMWYSTIGTDSDLSCTIIVSVKKRTCFASLCPQHAPIRSNKYSQERRSGRAPLVLAAEVFNIFQVPCRASKKRMAFLGSWPVGYRDSFGMASL